MIAAGNIGAASQRISCRRSPHVVAYWHEGQLVFHNYATGARVAGTAFTIGLLDFFSDWHDLDALFAASTLPKETLVAALDELLSTDLLQRSDRDPHPREVALEAWTSWNPSVGLLHSSTRDGDFEGGEKRVGEFLSDRIATKPQPERTKQYSDVPKLRLPQPDGSGGFPAVLLERRTWRRFGSSVLDSQALGTLLGLTFGVQRWIDQQALGRAMLRSSPSGGARHPIEAYAVIHEVDGVAPGLYHYGPDTHELAQLQSGDMRPRVAGYLPAQDFYAAASVLVLMTAVFTRTEWQYPFPRAYRVVHLEAGHFCQTFCLVATWLGLAPF
jgi:SagB-type dehydrogenase family enzyme